MHTIITIKNKSVFCLLLNTVFVFEDVTVNFLSLEVKIEEELSQLKYGVLLIFCTIYLFGFLTNFCGHQFLSFKFFICAYFSGNCSQSLFNISAGLMIISSSQNSE